MSKPVRCKVEISKLMYKSYLSNYGIDLIQDVLDDFELNQLFKLPKDLVVAKINNEKFDNELYYTTEIAYCLNDKYFTQFYTYHI